MPALHSGPVIAFFCQRQAVQVKGPRRVETVEIDLLQKADRFIEFAVLVGKVARTYQQIILQMLATLGIGVTIGHG